MAKRKTPKMEKVTTIETELEQFRYTCLTMNKQNKSKENGSRTTIYSQKK